jgi:iron complex transport system permease protein
MKSTPVESALYFLPLPLMFLSLLIGPSDIIGPADIVVWMQQEILSTPVIGEQKQQLVKTIVLDVRFPRILLAFMVGAALTVSGSALQALFRNPLVSPDILGLSSGAAFGAALALALPFFPLQTSAFILGLAAAGLTYFLAAGKRGVSTVSLILSGIIITGLFTALLTIVQFITDPFKLQTIVHWTMGNLHNASWSKVQSAAMPITGGIIWLFFMRWRLNVIALGDEETRAVGLHPEREKVMILIPATLIASASVAVAGIVGMVGLAVPHMVRLMVGPDNRKNQPLSIAFGGSFLVLVDTVSRTLTSFEIPIGIFTTLIGGPFFIYLLKRHRMIYTE